MSLTAEHRKKIRQRKMGNGSRDEERMGWIERGRRLDREKDRVGLQAEIKRRIDRDMRKDKELGKGMMKREGVDE